MSTPSARTDPATLTVTEILRGATQRLAARGIPSARLDAELLLAAAIGVDRTRLWTDGARPLDCESGDRFESALRRREAREPLQQIRGSQEFFSRDFDVSADVLIPRPETEILVEAAIDAVAGSTAPRIVDLGTGSGAIAITLAIEIPQARVVAIDVSEAAAGAARKNVRRLGVGDRVDVRSGDWTDPCRGESFDLVVSNPPYVCRGEIATLEPEVRDFEPRAALDGGVDGLDAYRRLAPLVGAILEPGGSVVLEIGHGQRAAVLALFGARGFAPREIRKDLAGIERVLVLARVEDDRG